MARRARYTRAAGLISGPDRSPPPSTLPEVGDFAGSERTAFWGVGTTLAITSGMNVLRDVRIDTGVTAGTFAWTQAVIDAVIAEVQRRTNTTARPTIEGEPDGSHRVMHRDFLKWALWNTYHSSGSHPVSRPADILLPSATRMPWLNYDYAGNSADYPVNFYPGVTGDYYALNPFTGRESPVGSRGVIRHDTIDVTGSPPRVQGPTTKRTSGGTDGEMVMLGVIAVMVLGLGGKE